MEGKFASASKVSKVMRVMPGDLNGHHTLFGGNILAEMDLISSLAAQRHSRLEGVTASMDSVEFLSPVKMSDSICYEACVIWTGTSSMEVFVRAIAEDLLTGKRRIAATSFVTFVALKDGKPSPVPPVIPQTDEEKKLYKIAVKRAENREHRKAISKEIAKLVNVEG